MLNHYSPTVRVKSCERKKTPDENEEIKIEISLTNKTKENFEITIERLTGLTKGASELNLQNENDLLMTLYMKKLFIPNN